MERSVKDINTSSKDNSMDKFIETFQHCRTQKEMEFHHNKIPKEKITTKLSLTNNRKRPAVDTTNNFTKAIKLNNLTVKESNFTYLPIPKIVKFNNKENEKNNSNVKEEKKDSSTVKNVMQQQTGRDMQLISGRVKFIIKIHKGFPDINAIYEVYGKIIKIIRRDSTQIPQLLILRDTTGPVLHGIYYEVNINCSYLQEGNYVCVIGRFTANNKLHIFKMRPLQYLPNDEVFNRLQNICNFTLNNIKVNRDNLKI